MTGNDWHAMEAEDVARYFAVDPVRGLDEAEATDRRKVYGRNQLSLRMGRGAVLRFLSQLFQPLVLVLIGSGAVTAVLGEWLDAGVIFGVVLINAAVGFAQEGKAEAALAALARAIGSEATVLRDGLPRRLDAAALVPGDVVILSPGDKSPADLRLIEGKGLRIAEAILTGESSPVGKGNQVLPAEAALAERSNMAYRGTLVVGGVGRGVVVAIGEATETGRISRLIAQAPDISTPLTRKMGAFARRLLAVIVALAAVAFAVGILRGESVFDMFMAAVALTVGAIPEGLPAAMTVTLAIGVARMARRRAIIRKLPAVETLGSTTVICADKTGTLTENAMTVQAVWAGGQGFAVTGLGYGPHGRIEADGRPAVTSGALRELLVAGALCNDARLAHEHRRWDVVGDPTEGALLALARKGGLDEVTLNSLYPRLDELPFDAGRRYMATLQEIEGRPVLYVKGAVEQLLPACATMLDRRGREIPFDTTATKAAVARLADSGMRILAMARTSLAQKRPISHVDVEQGLVFLGVAGMIDPPRPRAAAAVRTCHAAGIRVKMITGDHPGTAVAVARQLGIAGAGARALTGRELAALSDEEMVRAAAEFDLFARIEPAQKLQLVKVLQANGEVVAMTGDGVNDAPALKQADIGIAMGKLGTEVAKEAAAMVLTDDDFATIEAAIEEGRGIFDNLVKFIAWTIPTNAGEGLVVLAAILAGTALPISPLQILWINMTTVALLGTTLAFEPVEEGIMRRAPRPPAAPILDRVLVIRTLLVSLFLLGGAFSLFEAALHSGHSVNEARTIAANLFVIVEIFYLFNCRALAWPFRTSGVNRWVWAGSAAMLALQLVFTYVPVFNQAFQTAPLSLMEWLSITAVGGLCAIAVEAHKWWLASTGRARSSS